MAETFPADTVGAARDFLAAHTGLPRESVAHYATVTGDGDELTAIVTCCDDVDEAAVMLRTALAALGSGAPVTPESRSVMVRREDLREVLSRSGALPADVRERLRGALGQPPEIRGLSVRQPYCSAITFGDKRRENRTGRTSYRGLIALHAAREVEWKAPDMAWAGAGLAPYRPGSPREAWTESLPLGAVTGIAELAGCHNASDCVKGGFGPTSFCSPWSIAARFHWEIENVRPLAEPVPCKGKLGLWRLPEDVEAAVRAQLEADDG